MNFEVLY